METLFNLLAVIGLYFLLFESAGPFGFFSFWRGLLMRTKFIGVFFYKLFSCPFCSGLHCGYLIYLLSTPIKFWYLNEFLLWSLVGGTTCFLFSLMLDKLMGTAETVESETNE